MSAEVYALLHAAAAEQMRGERANHTLSATALVHEAFLRLAGPRDLPFRERAHFYAAVVEAMRRVLIDHARARGRTRRSAPGFRLDLDAAIDLADAEKVVDYIELDDAIDRLRGHDTRMAEIVRLRCYCGLPVAEVAQVLDISERTVKSEWAFAKSWLTRDLTDHSGGG